MDTVNINDVAKELSELIPTFVNKFIRPLEQQTKNCISPMQMHALFFLSQKETLTMSELSNGMKTSKQQMTPIIDKLVTSDFVRREHDDLDRRSVKIRLTSSGLDFINNCQKDMCNEISQKIRCLNDDDLHALHHSLSDLYRIIHKIP